MIIIMKSDMKLTSSSKPWNSFKKRIHFIYDKELYGQNKRYSHGNQCHPKLSFGVI